MNHKDSTHFTWNDRLTLERMLKEKFSRPKIAKVLGKRLRSVYYEIDRGLCVQQTTDYEFVERCCVEAAERKYGQSLSEKGPEPKIGHDHALVRKLEELIVKQKFSLGAVLTYIRNSEEKYDTEICETMRHNLLGRCVPCAGQRIPARKGQTALCGKE